MTMKTKLALQIYRDVTACSQPEQNPTFWVPGFGHVSATVMVPDCSGWPEHSVCRRVFGHKKGNFQVLNEFWPKTKENLQVLAGFRPQKKLRNFWVAGFGQQCSCQNLEGNTTTTWNSPQPKPAGCSASSQSKNFKNWISSQVKHLKSEIFEP